MRKSLTRIILERVLPPIMETIWLFWHDLQIAPAAYRNAFYRLFSLMLVGFGLLALSASHVIEALPVALATTIWFLELVWFLSTFDLSEALRDLHRPSISSH